MPLLPDNLESDQLVLIPLPTEGEWVRVKPRLSRGDQVAIRKAVARNATRDSEGKALINIEAALEAGEFAVLDIAIKAWSFEEPVTPEAIRRLDGDSVDAIKTRLEELYPAERTDDERRDLQGAGATPSSEKAPSPMSLAG